MNIQIRHAHVDEAPLVEAMFADHYFGFGKDDLPQ